jgi:uncharacterized protein YbaR (Trm112 family)
MLDPELLEILVCPESKAPVTLATPALLDRVNLEISAGRARARGGNEVHEPLVEALVRSGGDLLYPIRNGIPIMLIDEAISIDPPQGSTSSFPMK